MTFFYPLRHKKAFEIFDKIHNAALQEAKQVGERQKFWKFVLEFSPFLHMTIVQ